MDLDVPALFDMANMKMPYGKFKGWALIDLPEPYVIWINNNNLPQGKLGQLLKLLLAVKVNGLEHLIHPLKGKDISQVKMTPQFGGGPASPTVKAPESQDI